MDTTQNQPDPDDQWIADLFTGLPGATFEYKPEWDSWVAWVGGKMFAMRASHADKGELLTVKGNPADNEAIRHEFDSVEPGYYANKQHWVSVLLDQGQVPQDRLEELLSESYRLVRASLPKKVQAELGT